MSVWSGLRGVPALVHGWQSIRWETQDRARLLAQSRRAVANEQGLVDVATKAKVDLVALAPQLLSGETAAQASDALAGILNDVTTRANVKLTTVTAMADSTRVETLGRITVRVAVDGDIRGTVSMLEALAEEQTTLITDELHILPTAPTDVSPSAEVLHVEMTVRGWYWIKQGTESRIGLDRDPGGSQ